ncbi:hypothetical protein JCM10207_008006 [Rhodosporidiobolus poonsookiae]
MANKLVFYDLVGAPGGPYYSPNTYKTRFALLLKGIEFEVRDVKYSDLHKLAAEKGFSPIVCPLIQTPSGEYISDSWAIAEWLEENYPDAPSVFLPDSPTPVNSQSPELVVAKNYARMFTAGFGDSDPQWSTFFELVVRQLADLFEGEDQEYFKSDKKLGPNGWATFTSLDPAPLIARAQASILPLEHVLSSSAFLTGQKNPGFVDFVAYGRYQMLAACDAPLARTVWRRPEAPNVTAWIERIEERFRDGLEEVLRRNPK